MSRGAVPDEDEVLIGRQPEAITDADRPPRTVPPYRAKLSNSPFRTPPRKACHSAGVNRSTGPAESLLLRTPIVPPGRLATSTQLPLA
jgi:hypothetical protein